MEQSYPSPQQVNHTVVLATPKKSVGLAVVLALLFGPLGMLYVTVSGAVVMFFVALVLSVITLGFGLPLAWIACVIWALKAAEKANKN
ncbi:MAG: hypothetical protein H6568_10945 [Lewinellaceae bacterium]|nr:hypothetical protein [Saprospiraceae bacterium]MCB9313273.1 hypothetical protein [Lewinellaceae bacterium]